ncbi:DALR anticodon-binding domain-containing protein [Fischerella thermalis]|jgi:arginyl-tRNA synthetase|uniref:arginine--tRNA ligase n=63 Tax=Hapalosiphonaceae TaxID=1892263 RepID=G6FR44_9CYAN|nr:DALR anticodon-binding domain-containing protein [Fischerella thermalis]EHC15918.1 DALR anticodon binding domain protein [Fischerella thermalis JSC-11]PLZ11154.1 glutamate acetyltransferase [Fischerella thermalis WC119]PLZ27552.1 glutamate acetyltransferase [Fischerella thermalis WC558]PLZ29131.1 glutamate acetyltransferase [Fischerella thermalis WC341]PLZ46142.1 glutamate acetyltransferase [Fischerella thermalis WC442]
MLLVSKYTAIKQLVHSYFIIALSIYTYYSKIETLANKKIPLSKGRNSNQVFYITGLALQLSKYEKIPAMEIAEAIASHLSANSAGVFSIQIVPPGWIHLELAHPVLASWLQRLVEGRGNSVVQERGVTENKEDKEELVTVLFSSHSPSPQSPLPNHLFPIQYAHARCCSLVRLGEREGLITSEGAIPWLNKQQELHFHHPSELCLLSELVQVVDELECSDSSDSVKWQKLALGLSRLFDDFWRDCQIWGEVKVKSPEIALARLGLVMATQSVLRTLLEEKLGILAVLEL